VAPRGGQAACQLGPARPVRPGSLQVRPARPVRPGSQPGSQPAGARCVVAELGEQAGLWGGCVAGALGWRLVQPRQQASLDPSTPVPPAVGARAGAADWAWQSASSSSSSSSSSNHSHPAAALNLAAPTAQPAAWHPVASSWTHGGAWQRQGTGASLCGARGHASLGMPSWCVSSDIQGGAPPGASGVAAPSVCRIVGWAQPQLANTVWLVPTFRALAGRATGTQLGFEMPRLCTDRHVWGTGALACRVSRRGV
jgi:hypothetical protein